MGQAAPPGIGGALEPDGAASRMRVCVCQIVPEDLCFELYANFFIKNKATPKKGYDYGVEELLLPQTGTGTGVVP